ncbi:hypothetical protein BDN70DRAFT_877270, partial [Pholiota conissans]
MGYKKGEQGYTVERAFSAHISGSYKAPPQFTHDNYWQALKVFFGHISSVSERRWYRILALGPAIVSEPNEDLMTDQSMISCIPSRNLRPSQSSEALFHVR